MNGFLEVASDELLKDVEHISYKKKGETHSFKVIGYDVQNQTFGGENFKTVTFFGSNNQTYVIEPTFTLESELLKKPGFDWNDYTSLDEDEEEDKARRNLQGKKKKKKNKKSFLKSAKKGAKKVGDALEDVVDDVGAVITTGWNSFSDAIGEAVADVLIVWDSFTVQEGTSFKLDKLSYENDWIAGAGSVLVSESTKTKFDAVAAKLAAAKADPDCNGDNVNSWLGTTAGQTSLNNAIAKCGGHPSVLLYNLRGKLAKLKQEMTSKTMMVIDCGSDPKYFNEYCYHKQGFTLAFTPQLKSYLDYHVASAKPLERLGSQVIHAQNAFMNSQDWGDVGAISRRPNYQALFLGQYPPQPGSGAKTHAMAHWSMAMFSFMLRSRRLARALTKAIYSNNYSHDVRTEDVAKIHANWNAVSNFNEFPGAHSSWNDNNFKDILALTGQPDLSSLAKHFCPADKGQCWISQTWKEDTTSVEGIAAAEMADGMLPLDPSSGKRTLVYHGNGNYLTKISTWAKHDNYKFERNEWPFNRFGTIVEAHKNAYSSWARSKSHHVNYHLMMMNSNEIPWSLWSSAGYSNHGTKLIPEKDLPDFCVNSKAAFGNGNKIWHTRHWGGQRHDLDWNMLAWSFNSNRYSYANKRGWCRLICDYGEDESHFFAPLFESGAYGGEDLFMYNRMPADNQLAWYYPIPQTRFCKIGGLAELDGLIQRYDELDAVTDGPGQWFASKADLKKARDSLWAAYAKHFAKDDNTWTFSIGLRKNRPVMHFDMMPADFRLIKEMFDLVHPQFKLSGVVSVRKDHGGGNGVWQSSVWQSSVWESGSQSSSQGDVLGSEDGAVGADTAPTSTPSVWQSSVWANIWQSSVWDTESSSMDVWQSSVWQSSIWQSQMWHSGQSSIWGTGQSSVWQSSVWGQSSVWQSSVWQSSVWGQSAVWQSSVWQSSIWQSSVWQSSVWQSSVWQSSVWQSSVWGQSAVWQSSVWQSSVWQSAVWQSSVWQSSVWQSSIWQSSIWQSSIWDSLSGAEHVDITTDFEVSTEDTNYLNIFKSTKGEKYDPTTTDGMASLKTLMQDGGCRVWQSSIWQSSVWQSSVWQSAVWESRAMRILQSSIWQSAVWKNHWWVGKVWRMSAVNFKSETINTNSPEVLPMSWKTFSLNNNVQACPPLHLKQVTDSDFAFPETLPSETCFPESIDVPSSGLGEDVHIFVFDTGVDIFHPDLMGAVYDSETDSSFSTVQTDSGEVISANGHFNAVAKEAECDVDVDCILKFGNYNMNTKGLTSAEYCTNPLVDCHGHGTHTASLAVGSVSGVAKKAVLHSVRVANCKGIAETADIVRGLQFVEKIVKQQGWKAVVSLSLGGSKDAEMESALTSLINIGIPAVCAAGNTAQDSNSFSPAGLSTCITVGASDPFGYAAPFSNYGTALDVFAPGVEVTTAAAVAEVCREGMYSGSSKPTVSRSTYPGDDIYTTATGTSFACPIVTGIVASKLSALTYTSSSKTIDFDGTACTYLDSVDGTSPCSLLMSDFIVNNAAEKDTLALRTPTATATFTKKEGEDSATVSTDDQFSQQTVYDTTTKFVQWPSTSSRRSLQSQSPSRQLFGTVSLDSGMSSKSYTQQNLMFDNSDDVKDEMISAIAIENDQPDQDDNSAFNNWLDADKSGGNLFGLPESSNTKESVVCIPNSAGGAIEFTAYVQSDSSSFEVCNAVPLSQMLFRWQSKIGKSIEFQLVISSDNMVYDKDVGQYVYRTKVTVPKGCYAIQLLRHLADWRTENILGNEPSFIGNGIWQPYFNNWKNDIYNMPFGSETDWNHATSGCKYTTKVKAYWY